MILTAWEIFKIVSAIAVLIPFFIPVIAHAQTNIVRMDSAGRAYIGNVPALDSVSTLAVSLNKKAAVLFSQISTVNIVGYTLNTDYSIKGQIVGSDTIKASTVSNGKTFIGFESGTYSTPTVNLGSITVKVMLNGVAILANTFSSLPLNISQLPYTCKIQFVARANTVAADGYVEFNTLTAPFSMKLFFPTTVTAMDWSNDKVYNATVQYTTAGSSLTSVNHTLISLN